MGEYLWSKTAGYFVFWCPGCDSIHGINDKIWSVIDPDSLTPTVHASVLSYPHRTFKPGVTDAEIEAAKAITPAGEPLAGVTMMTPLCHLFIEKGQIRFLGDCEHALAGQTVPMVPVPVKWRG
jgi:hypothetical protein